MLMHNYLNYHYMEMNNADRNKKKIQQKLKFII